MLSSHLKAGGLLAALVIVCCALAWCVRLASTPRAPGVVAGAGDASLSTGDPLQATSSPSIPTAVEGGGTRVQAGAAALVLSCQAPFPPEPFGWPLLLLENATEKERSSHRARATIRFGDLVPGQWQVRLCAPGWEDNSLSIELAPGVESHGTIALAPSTSYLGVVIDAATLEPIANYTLTPRWRTHDADGRLVLHSWTAVQVESATGEFALTGPVENAIDYGFEVHAPGYRVGESEWLPATPGTHLTDLLVLLDAEATRTLRGEVVDAVTGAAISGAHVWVVKGGNLPELSYFANGDFYIGQMEYTLEELATRAEYVRSSENGTWRLAVPESREFRIMAARDGYQTGVSEVFVPGFPANLDCRLALTRGARIHGRVLWVEHAGEPMPAEVRLSELSTGTRRGVGLTEDLEFVVSGLEAGTFQVEVFGQLPAERDLGTRILLANRTIELANGQEFDLEIPCGVLAPGRSLQGQVLFPSDVGWQAGVALFDGHPATQAPWATAIVNEAGTFVLHGLPVEDPSCVLWLEGFSTSNDDRLCAFLMMESIPTGELSIDLTSTILAIEWGMAHDRLPANCMLSQQDAHPWLNRFLSESLQLTPKPGSTTTIHGLPSGNYRLDAGTVAKEFMLGAGRNVLQLP